MYRVITVINLNETEKLGGITVPVRNPVSFNKSIFKVVSTSSVRPSKPICDSASFFGTGQPIRNKNVRPSKTVSASSVSPGTPI